MWPIIWAATRTYAPYITLPVAFVVGAVGYTLEKLIRGSPQQTVEEKSILEMREERALQEVVGSDPTKVISLKERLEFKPKAVLYSNRQEKS